MQHERVGIGPKLGNNKRHTMLHKPADVVDVAAKPIELGDDDVSLRPFGALDGLYQLGSMILAAALDFRQGFQEGEAIGLGKPLQCLLLGLKAQARTPLLGGRDADVVAPPSCDD
jgi:hypothetical protein